MKMVYYELRNTVTEYSSSVSGRYSNMDAAKADMKNHSDFYAPNGTGTIYEVTVAETTGNRVSITERKVYQK